MQLKRIPCDFSVCKVADYSLVNLQAEYCFIGRTDEENSLVCLTQDVPTNAVQRDDGWKAFRIQGVLDFSLIGILSRMKVVVSMRLHGLIFSASQGVPLVGIVYDQKVSSFLSYIGQDLYEDLNAISAESLCSLIDQAVERGKDPDFLSESVEKLRRMEEVNRQVVEEFVRKAD